MANEHKPLLSVRDLALGFAARRGVVTAVSGISFEVAAGESEQLEALVRDTMGSAAELSVPLEVSVGYGRTWDEAAH